jgi:hypothetical protein
MLNTYQDQDEARYVNCYSIKPASPSIKPTSATKTYRIVNSRDCVIDDLTGLTLSDAETALCRCINHGHDAYIQDEPSFIEMYQAKKLTREQVYELIAIGFCQPKFYKTSVWKKARALMDQIVCPLGFAFPHDYGRGKGKYSTDFSIDEVKDDIACLIAIN